MREILPWLKLSAELDPENIKTYVVTAFWLRTKLNQVSEAEQVLREGLRHNPDNAQLLFELGRIYFENYHNPVQRAKHLGSRVAKLGAAGAWRPAIEAA